MTINYRQYRTYFSKDCNYKCQHCQKELGGTKGYWAYIASGMMGGAYTLCSLKCFKERYSEGVSAKLITPKEFNELRWGKREEEK